MKILGTFASLMVMAFIAMGALSLVLTACSRPPRPKMTCTHPGVMGGMPFELPANYTTDEDGSVNFSPEGVRVRLLGATCISVTLKK